MCARAGGGVSACSAELNWKLMMSPVQSEREKELNNRRDNRSEGSGDMT